jgi:hypothetical protein
MTASMNRGHPKMSYKETLLEIYPVSSFTKTAYPVVSICREWAFLIDCCVWGCGHQQSVG